MSSVAPKTGLVPADTDGSTDGSLAASGMMMPLEARCAGNV